MISKRLFSRITFIGTSSGVPTQYRNVSSYCVAFTDGAVWMFDCGEGTQHRLQSCDTISLGRIERLFLTHLHGDHCYGLPGMLCSLAMTWGKKKINNTNDNNSSSPTATSAASPTKSEEEEEEGNEEVEQEQEQEFKFTPFLPHSEYFEIIGPEKTGDFVRAVFNASQAYFPFKFRITELLKPGSKVPSIQDLNLHCCEATPTFILPDPETGCYDNVIVPPSSSSNSNTNNNENNSAASSGTSKSTTSTQSSFSVGEITVKAAPLKHTVFCVGYSLTEPDTPGTLDINKADKLGVPKGPLLAKLKAGETVSFLSKQKKNDDKKEQKEEPSTSTPTTIVVTSDQVVGPPIPGRTILCLGDTFDASACMHIIPNFFPNNNNKTNNSGTEKEQEDYKVETVIHESTFDDTNASLAIPRGHSTARMAGEFASKIKAKQLILTHFSARFLPPSKDPEPIKILIREAEEGASSSSTVTNKEEQQQEQEQKKVIKTSSSPITVLAACDYSCFELARKKNVEKGSGVAKTKSKK